jgi:hypothetical protein
MKGGQKRSVARQVGGHGGAVPTVFVQMFRYNLERGNPVLSSIYRIAAHAEITMPGDGVFLQPAALLEGWGLGQPVPRGLPC